MLRPDVSRMLGFEAATAAAVPLPAAAGPVADGTTVAAQPPGLVALWLLSGTVLPGSDVVVVILATVVLVVPPAVTFTEATVTPGRVFIVRSSPEPLVIQFAVFVGVLVDRFRATGTWGS